MSDQQVEARREVSSLKMLARLRLVERAKNVLPVAALTVGVILSCGNVLAGTPAQIMPPDYNEVFSADDVMNGPSGLSEAECAAKPNAVYVHLGLLRNACIRYFPSDDVGTTKDVMFFFHGDRNPYPMDSQAAIDSFRRSYSKEANYKAQVAQANMYAKANNVAVIFVGRPGVFGSTGGVHVPGKFMVSYSKDEGLYMDAAVTLIKQRHGYDRINIVGQSGGGQVVAKLLGNGRTDVNCAISSSGALSMKTLNYDRSTNWRAELQDPIDTVKDIAADPKRRFIALSDRLDARSPVRNQTEYVEKVASLGHSSTQIWVVSKDQVDHHALNNEGIKATGWCIAGWTNQQIEAGLAKGALPVGRFSADTTPDQILAAAK